MKLGIRKLALATGLAAALVGALVIGSPGSASAGANPATIDFASVEASVALNADINFDVVSTGTSVDPYVGFNIGIDWTTTGSATVTFQAASNAGTVIPSPFCPAAVITPPPGVVYACTSLGGPTSSVGQLANFNFDTTGTGCATFHLYTFGAPDNGGTSEGTYLVNQGVPATAQPNPLGADVQVAIGSPTACAAGPTPTNTSTGGGGGTTTPTQIVRTATPTPSGDTPTPGATDTSVPGETATTAPPTGASPTSPAGGPGGGGVQPPDTGTGGSSDGTAFGLTWVIAIAAAGLAAAGGAVAVRKARDAR